MPKNNSQGPNRIITLFDENGGANGKAEHSLLMVVGSALTSPGRTLTSLRRL